MKQRFLAALLAAALVVLLLPVAALATYLSAEAGADVTIVSGESTTLTGTASGGTSPYAYKWTVDGGTSAWTTAEITVDPTATTTYRLTVTDNTGTIADDTVTVTVEDPNPSISVSPIQLTFEAVEGYAEPSIPTQTITITNTGNIDLTDLVVTHPDALISNSSGKSISISKNSAFVIIFVLQPGIAVGSHTGSIAIAKAEYNINETVGVTVNLAAKSYAAEITPAGDYAFPQKTVGYTIAAGDAQEFTVNNTGNQPLTNLSVALTGANSGSFTLTDAPAAGAALGDTPITFTVTPNDGLAPGTYAATIEVNATELTTAVIKKISFTVAEPTYGITATGGNTGSTYAGNEYPGSLTGNTLTVQGNCANLTSVMVDNTILTQARDYTVGCGSTVVTFTPAFLATLRDGAHTVKVQFTDGRYVGMFTTPIASAAAAVPDVPATGGPAAAFVWFVCGACCVCVGMALRKRREDSSA